MNFKHSLISSLNIILYYVCINVVLCAGLAVVYMVYNLCISLVAGQQLYFDALLFIDGILLFEPLVMILSALLMAFFMIRHPDQSILPLIVYALLYVSLWIFCIPGVVKCDFTAVDKYTQMKIEAEPSDGYFRKNEGMIFYYSDVNHDTKLLNGLCIDTGKKGNNVYTFSNLELAKNQTVFVDSLIQDTIAMPASLAICVNFGNELCLIMRKCAKSSFAYWLCFASMGLPLLAVVALRYFSKWRLVNVVAIFIVTSGVLVLNVLGYTSPAFVSVESVINGTICKAPFMKSLCSVGNPCIVISNILIFIVLVILFFVFEAREAKIRQNDMMEI